MIKKLFDKIRNWLCTHQNIKMVATFKGMEPGGYNIVCRECDKILDKI